MEKSGNPRFARYAWGVLAYNIGVVLWGAFVRATGSGAGCGNHWPQCNGEVIPRSPSIATLIEFTHRATSGIDLLLVALLLVWAWRAFPRGHAARLGAALSAIFLITEALIGAALVLLEHVASNPSAARGYSLTTHLINTLTLLACLTLTAWWAGGAPRVRIARPQVSPVAISLGLVMLMGVTGAIAALGDTLFPSRSLSAGFAQDFDPAANIFVRLRLIHPMLAALVAAWLVFFGVTSPATALPYSRWMLAVLTAQIAAGIANWLLLAPVWMQLLHLLLADLLWVALVLLCAVRLSGFQNEPKFR